jgi:hypothetical protein
MRIGREMRKLMQSSLPLGTVQGRIIDAVRGICEAVGGNVS